MNSRINLIAAAVVAQLGQSKNPVIIFKDEDVHAINGYALRKCTVPEYVPERKQARYRFDGKEKRRW